MVMNANSPVQGQSDGDAVVDVEHKSGNIARGLVSILATVDPNDPAALARPAGHEDNPIHVTFAEGGGGEDPEPTPAGENLIGLTGTPGDVISFTPTLDTSAYATGDTLFIATVTNAVRINGGRAILQSLTLLDKDDQGVAMDLFLLEANNALGTNNAAPSISDTNAEAAHFIGSVVAADWIDLGGSRVCTLKGVGLMVEAAAGSRDLFIAAITRGAPTHTAAGIVGRAALVQL